MPSSKSNNQPHATGQSAAGSTNTSAFSQPKSQNQLIKDAGFDNMDRFMKSYGLKMHDHDDVQEAKDILDGYRQINIMNSGKK